MRAWIRILDAPVCYERAVLAERKSALQGSGLVITVGLCAQRRVAFMPQAIARCIIKQSLGAIVPRISLGTYMYIYASGSASCRD